MVTTIPLDLAEFLHLKPLKILCYILSRDTGSTGTVTASHDDFRRYSVDNYKSAYIVIDGMRELLDLGLLTKIGQYDYCINYDKINNFRIPVSQRQRKYWDNIDDNKRKDYLEEYKKLSESKIDINIDVAHLLELRELRLLFYLVSASDANGNINNVTPQRLRCYSYYNFRNSTYIPIKLANLEKIGFITSIGTDSYKVNKDIILAYRLPFTEAQRRYNSKIVSNDKAKQKALQHQQQQIKIKARKKAEREELKRQREEEKAKKKAEWEELKRQREEEKARKKAEREELKRQREEEEKRKYQEEEKRVAVIIAERKKQTQEQEEEIQKSKDREYIRLLTEDDEQEEINTIYDYELSLISTSKRQRKNKYYINKADYEIY